MPVYSIATKKKNVREQRQKKRAEKEHEEDEESVAETESQTSEDGDAAAPSKTAASKVEFSEPSQWVERMALTSTKSLPDDLNADDDPKREEAFIQQTLLSVGRGIALLEEAGIPWKRPSDYYAEMIKSDTHMHDVRQAMEASRARIESQAHRRAMKDQKKYGKEVQAEVLRQRAKYKRDMQDRLSDWKKKRKGDGHLQDMLNEDDEEGGKGGRKKSQTPRPRNVRPGGGARKRPGKNARRKH